MVSNIFYFIFTTTWGNDPIWRSYFSNGLKPPTSHMINLITFVPRIVDWPVLLLSRPNRSCPARSSEHCYTWDFKRNAPAPRFCWQDLPHITLLLLMEEILHQLICSFSHYLQGFIHPRWCRISSINSIIPPSSVSFGKKPKFVGGENFCTTFFVQINGLPGHLSQETRITFAGFDEPNILGSYGLVAWTRCGDWWRSLDTQNLPLLGFTNEEIQLFFWDVSFDWIFWITTASKRSAFSKSRCKVRVLKANNSEKDANTMLHHCLKTK